MNCSKCENTGVYPVWDENYRCVMHPCDCPLGERFKPKPVDPAEVKLTGRDKAAGTERDE